MFDANLIRVSLARADALGLPCYMKSSNPRNVRLYLRHGFVTLEEYYPFETSREARGPVMTLMLRERKRE